MKIVNLRRFLLVVSICFISVGCQVMLAPELDNEFGEERASVVPQTALGFLNTAYLALPTTYDFSECVTDDAVINDLMSSLPRVATGAWSALLDPMERWTNSYRAIMNVNQFITYLPRITISWSNEKTDSLYRDRWKGEAHGIRAYHHLMLFEYYGGKSSDNELLGVPYLDKIPDITNNTWRNIKRLPYDQTIMKIAQDLDTAIRYLPLDYSGSSNPVTGLKNRSRFTQRIAYASKARLYMHAASPLYNEGTYHKAYCDSAVKYSALAIAKNAIGTSYTNQLFYSSDSPSTTEVIWRMNMIGEASNDADMRNTIEARNYPPSKAGLGQVNPTQDFVDAFPDATGYPITESTIYNGDIPYLSRDPRLDRIVVRDGGEFAGSIIHTSKDNLKDGIENTGTTRTGYYLKKLLRPDVSITDPIAGKKNCRPLFRCTEMFLIFAEAMTASQGADASYTIGTTSQTPRKVIKSIRRRSGIPQDDPYASNLSEAKYMELIRNERRIELSFEGFRFTDLRRWGLPLNGAVKRARISVAGGTPEILPIAEEIRNFGLFNYFAPIPNKEIIKCPSIKQNGVQ